MRIGIIGAGRIGGHLARRLAEAGHEVRLSYARDRAKLEAQAVELGPRAAAGTVAEAAAFGEVVVVSVPWGRLDEVAAEIGPDALAGKIVVDTTNPFGPAGVEPLPDGLTAVQLNARRLPGARLVKTFNTLTAAFQAEAAGRTGGDRVAMFFAADDPGAIATAERLIDDVGFAPVRIGGLADAAPMEPPRRAGSVYGEEYHLPGARAFLAGLGPSPSRARERVVEIIRYAIPAEGHEAFLAAYTAASVQLDAAPECLAYEVTQGVEEPDSWIVRIEWSSVEEHERGFRRSAAFGPFLAAVRPFIPRIAEMRHYRQTPVMG